MSQNDWTEGALLPRLDYLHFQSWQDRTTGVSFILSPAKKVPGGKFLMGSAPDDPLAYDFEKPQYFIPTDPFEMAIYPVTVAEYALYLQANPGVPLPPDRQYPKHAEWLTPEWQGKKLTWVLQQQRPDHPIVCITWFNARDYAAWLTKVSGESWRLPTEAEWEKAARGSEGLRWPWGNEFGDDARANTQEYGPKFMTPVGTYQKMEDASPYGCHDMAGNVWEWCSSLFLPYPYDQFKCEKAGDMTQQRVLRGGSFRTDSRIARTTNRGGDQPDTLSSLIGFRLVRDIARKAS
jgi:formylglycine-generating enzyme required for sulfatase activity